LKELQRAVRELERGGAVTLSRAPDGFDAFAAADLARALAGKAEGRAVVFAHVARDGQRSRAFQDALAFAAPELEILDFPAWDCQPYDRVSPNAAVSARRMTALSRLARSGSSAQRPRVLCTTVNALVQRVAPLNSVAADTFSAAPGNVVKTERLRSVYSKIHVIEADLRNRGALQQHRRRQNVVSEFGRIGHEGIHDDQQFQRTHGMHDLSLIRNGVHRIGRVNDQRSHPAFGGEVNGFDVGCRFESRLTDSPFGRSSPVAAPSKTNGHECPNSTPAMR